jgi:type VI secretion system lysozyme-like protein
MSGKLVESAWVPILDRLVDLDPRRPYRPPVEGEVPHSEPGAAPVQISRPAAERKPWRILDREGLMRSIRLELHRLLNTRSHYAVEANGHRQRTVIDYGLPDYSALYTRNPEDHKRLAALVQSTVEAYEPRIRNVRIEVILADDGGLALTEKSDTRRDLLVDADAPRELTLSIDNQRELLVTIHGETDLGQLMEPVSFKLAADEPDAAYP